MPPIDFYNNNDSRTHLRAHQTPMCTSKLGTLGV